MKKELERLTRAFCDALAAQNYRPRTVQCYGKGLAQFCAWLRERPEYVESLADVTSAVLSEYSQHLLLRPKLVKKKGQGWVPGKASLTARSRHLLLSPLRLWFAWLVRRRELLLNPAADLQLPRYQKRLPRVVLTVGEVARLLVAPPVDTPQGLRDRALLELFYATGVRRAEGLGILLKDLRLQEQELLVRGKGDRERLVPVGREATRALAVYLGEGRRCFPTPEDPHLFLSSTSGPLRATELFNRLKDYARAAGLEKKKVTPHGLRHACATHLLRHGADIRQIQVLLGHACLSSTQIYTRVELSQLRQVLLRCHPREQRP